MIECYEHLCQMGSRTGLSPNSRGSQYHKSIALTRKRKDRPSVLAKLLFTPFAMNRTLQVSLYFTYVHMYVHTRVYTRVFSIHFKCDSCLYLC